MGIRDASHATTSFRTPALVLRAGALGVALLAVSASIAATPVSILEGQLRAHSELRDFFDGRRIIVPNSRRAEIAGQRAGVYGAIVIWSSPAIDVSSSLGGMYCRAAIIRAILEEILSTRVTDSVLREEVLLNASASARFTGLKGQSTELDSSSNMATCEVAATGIEIDRSDAAIETTVASAAYGLAKRLIDEGKRAHALEVLKLTRGDPNIYVNAMAVMAYLLLDVDPGIAERLETEHVDAARITDPYAARALAEYYRLRRSGRLRD